MSTEGVEITLGPLAMNTGIPDVNGARWWTEGEIGGWASPAERMTSATATGRHGSTKVEHMFNERVITLTGICVHNGGEAAYWDAYNYLIGVTSNLFNQQYLTVGEVPLAKRVRVTRGGSPSISEPKGNYFNWQITLFASDPLKYPVDEKSVVLAPGETAVLINNGTFHSSPVATMAGTGTLNLWHGQQQAKVVTGQNTLTDGTADFAAHTLKQGGANRYGLLTPATYWWTIAPGSNTVRNDGTTPVTLRWRDAYL